MDRFHVWIHHIWKHIPKEYRDGLRASWVAVWATVALFAFLYGLSYAIAFNLVQIQTVVSFGLVELFAFFLAKYFLSERREKRSVMELMAVVDNLPKYSHLIVHYVNNGLREDYPRKPEYVLNTRWNWAFWVPPYIRELANVGAIQRVEHDTEDEMYEVFRANKVNIVRGRFPQAYELSSDSRPTTQSSGSP
jgi:hypothetical protein